MIQKKLVKAALVQLASCAKLESEIVVPFEAQVEGDPVEVTAVLDRTAVYRIRVGKHEEMRLANQHRVMVERARLRYKKQDAMLAMYAKGRRRGKATQMAELGE